MTGSSAAGPCAVRGGITISATAGAAADTATGLANVGASTEDNAPAWASEGAGWDVPAFCGTGAAAIPAIPDSMGTDVIGGADGVAGAGTAPGRADVSGRYGASGWS